MFVFDAFIKQSARCFLFYTMYSDCVHSIGVFILFLFAIFSIIFLLFNAIRFVYCSSLPITVHILEQRESAFVSQEYIQYGSFAIICICIYFGRRNQHDFACHCLCFFKSKSSIYYRILLWFN